MANALYPKTKAKFLQAGFDILAENIRAILVDASYTYNAAHDFLDDISGGDIVATSGNLAGKTVSADGWFDSSDPVFTAVTGPDDVERIILYRHTGTAGTSELIAYIDTGVTGLPLTPDGSDVQIVVDANGWFQL